MFWKSAGGHVTVALNGTFAKRALVKPGGYLWEQKRGQQCVSNVGNDVTFL